ncbi:MAG TPA: lipocalin family protein [Pseudomonadales bacterium]|nr:lipocalin family protein [Pseudomonadales bacterium]
MTRPRRAIGAGLLAATLALLTACVAVPDGLEPVTGFEAERYLGTWYEIARLDHSFERGLTQVRATYGLRDDGGLSVLNEGIDEDGERQSAEGRAYFVEGPDTGYLKVSFFGPFYGSYVVFDLDREAYQWALVSGPNRDYFWLLARQPDLDPALVERLVARAGAAGFDVGELIRVRQD